MPTGRAERPRRRAGKASRSVGHRYPWSRMARCCGPGKWCGGLRSDSKPAPPFLSSSRRIPPPRVNVTDPQSRVMRTRKGWLQGYNVQVGVTGDQLIVATRVSQHTNDREEFIPMMAAVQEAAELFQAAGRDNAVVGLLLADAGYASDTNLAALGPDRLIALASGRHQHRAAVHEPTEGPPPAGATPREAMRHRLRTPEGAATYKRRGATVEPGDREFEEDHQWPQPTRPAGRNRRGQSGRCGIQPIEDLPDDPRRWLTQAVSGLLNPQPMQGAAVGWSGSSGNKAHSTTASADEAQSKLLVRSGVHLPSGTQIPARRTTSRFNCLQSAVSQRKFGMTSSASSRNCSSTVATPSTVCPVKAFTSEASVIAAM